MQFIVREQREMLNYVVRLGRHARILYLVVYHTYISSIFLSFAICDKCKMKRESGVISAKVMRIYFPSNAHKNCEGSM